MSFKRNTGHLLCFFTLLFILQACEKAVPDRDIDAEIQQVMQNNNLPSLVVAVVDANSILWQRSYGSADIGHDKPASKESIYHMASISKLMIATAVMQLAEKGQLDIDADINAYLPVSIRNPHFPETIITTRMLLTHSAGIAWPQTYIEAKGLWEHFPPDEAPYPSAWVPEYMVPDGADYNHRIWKNTKPGTFELYSNIGSNVIAYIVEQVSGLDFRTYCRQHIFLPLDMLSTSFNIADIPQEKLAVLYDHDGSVFQYFDDRIAASGGLKASLEDLSKFLRCYLNDGTLNGKKILDAATIKQMMEVQNPVSGVGLLWQAGVGGWFGHLGGMDGAATCMDIHREDQIGIILFTNVHNSIVYQGHELYGLVRQKANEFRN